MRPFVVIVLYEGVNTLAQFLHTLCRIQIDILLLDGAPKSLYPDIVFASSLPVHADLDVETAQQVEPGLGGKLAALVRVQNLRCAILADTVSKFRLLLQTFSVSLEESRSFITTKQEFHYD